MTTSSQKSFSYIRMSTSEQLKGDSLRRQLMLAEAYAAEHGLVLDDKFRLQDIGVSAFDGSNVERGDLGIFLAAVKQGKIAKGSMLLLESFDRMSRANLQSSISIMMDLLNAGITIVTLSDKKQFIPGKTDFVDIIGSIVVLSRAHEESAQKSKRLRAAWENKRNKISDFKLTGRCPGWLCLKENKFVLVPEIVSIVRRIFDETLHGIGCDSIARRLNLDSIKPFRKSKGWQKSSVQKIVASRAVIGEFQPMKLIEGIRIPVGSAIDNYFPSIIDETTFYGAQSAIQARFMGGGGRKGKNVSNLFQKIAVCGYCGSKLHYLNKGQKGSCFLVCDSARRGLGCDMIPWNYQDFEISFLSFCSELDLNAISTPEANKLNSIQSELLGINGRLSDARKRSDLIFTLMTESNNPVVSLKGKFHAIDDEIQDLISRQTLLEAEQQEYQIRKNDAETIAFTIARIQDTSSDDLFKLRSEVALKIAGLVEKILVYPQGHQLSDDKKLQRHEILKSAGFTNERISEYHRDIKSCKSKGFRCFTVMFKNGNYRFIQPDANYPQKYFMLASTKEGIISKATLLLRDGSPNIYAFE